MDDQEKYILARWAYSVNRPFISDAEYNILRPLMETRYPTWEYCTRSWSDDPCPIELLKKYNMIDLIQSVILGDKTESMPTVNTMTGISSKFYNIKKGKLSYKHDGWNIQASYYNHALINLQTRGRTTTPMSLDRLKYRIPQEIPQSGKVMVVCELAVSFQLFKIMKEKHGNVMPRSAVPTAIALGLYDDLLHIHAFDIQGVNDIDIFNTLRAWEFKTPAWEDIDDYQDLLNKIQVMSDAYESYETPSDGLVLAIGRDRTALRIGAWEEEIYRSYVTGYEESYGPYNIAMKVNIKPVKTIKGMQRRISMTNLSRIIQNNLQIGAPIAFKVISSAYGDIHEEATRMLQTQYEGNWAQYQHLIDEEEVLKAATTRG